MGLFTRIKNLFSGIKNKSEEIKFGIGDFVQAHRVQIAQAMQLADLAYDNFEGSQKMKSVISFFITGVNTKCGTSFNAEEIGTEKTKELEEKFEEIYQDLKSVK